jgi:hypothetical protein
MSRNILLIENDLSYATAIRQALTSSNHRAYEVEWVRHCIEGLERLVEAGKQERHSPSGIAAVLANLYLARRDADKERGYCDAACQEQRPQ